MAALYYFVDMPVDTIPLTLRMKRKSQFQDKLKMPIPLDYARGDENLKLG